jgi:hypothetical protein
MLFEFTPEEIVAFEEVEALEDEVEVFARENGLSDRLSLLRAQPEVRERYEALKGRLEALRKDSVLQAYVLKMAMREKIDDKLDGLSPAAMIRIARQMIASLRTDTDVIGIAHTVRDAVLLISELACDPTLQDAMARVKQARYDALLRTGMPQHLCEAVLVAESRSMSSTLENSFRSASARTGK